MTRMPAMARPPRVRIVYLDRSAIATEVRRPAFEHEWIEYPATFPEDVRARLQGATIAITPGDIEGPSPLA
jgi:hypothetical protein